jgi:hypothetical protein
MALAPSSWPPAGRSWWPPTGGSNRLRGPVPAGAGRARLGPLTLPCRLGTAASFDYTGFNGRALSDDVMDVMLSPRASSAPGDGVASDPARIHADSRISISGRQPEGRIEQVTAAESFDAGIARQIGQCADAVRVPVGYDHILVFGTPELGPDGSLPGDMTRPGHPGMAEHPDDPEPGRREPLAIASVRQWLTSAEDVRASVEVRSKFITR